MSHDGPTLLLRELRRRQVFRVAGWYVVGAWLGVQVATQALPYLGFSDRVIGYGIAAAILGFPAVVALAWIFEFTPAGIQRTLPEPAVGMAPAAIRRAATWALVSIVAGSLGLGAWAVQRIRTPPGPLGEGGTPPPSRIAVLYFDDHSPGRDAGYLADGLTEGLIHELSQVESLDIISRNGVKPYRGGTTSLDSIVRALGVGTVVEGSVARAEGRIRVSVQLVDAVRGVDLASHTIEPLEGDLFLLQDELVGEVSRLLRKPLGEEIRIRERRSRTTSIPAWEAMQRAEQQLAELPALEGDTPMSRLLLDRADSLLAEAERLDPTWTEPALQRGWIRVGSMVRSAPRAVLLPRYEEGLAFAERAIATSPGDAAALELRGALRFAIWDGSPAQDSAHGADLRDAAERDLRDAIAAEPKRANALYRLGWLLRRKGEFAEASALVERAYREDEFLAEADRILHSLSQLALDLEDYEGALRWADEGRRRFPDQLIFPTAALVTMASAKAVSHDAAKAWQLADEIVALSAPQRRRFDDAKTRMLVASVLALGGMRDSAEAVVDHAHELAAEHDPDRLLTYYEAPARLFLGQRREALALLEAYVKAFPNRREFLASDWWFKDLWDDPRFQALVRGH